MDLNLHIFYLEELNVSLNINYLFSIGCNKLTMPAMLDGGSKNSKTAGYC